MSDQLRRPKLKKSEGEILEIVNYMILKDLEEQNSKCKYLK